MRKTDVKKIKKLVNSLSEAYEHSIIKDENVGLYIKKLSETIDNISKMNIVCSSKIVEPSPRRSYIIIDPVTAHKTYKNLTTIQGIKIPIGKIKMVDEATLQIRTIGKSEKIQIKKIKH